MRRLLIFLTLGLTFFALSGCAGHTKLTAGATSVSYHQITVFGNGPASFKKVAVAVHLPDQATQPRKAVLFLSGCDGGHWIVHDRLSKSLIEKGVVVAEVQSIETFGDQCLGTSLMGRDRSLHAFLAKDLLIDQGWAQRDQVGIVGLSHGGWTALNASRINLPYAGDTLVRHLEPFAVAVALYPHCSTYEVMDRNVITPLLLLGGSADDWTPMSVCKRTFKNDSKVKLIEYEGATHAWDAPIPPRYRPTHRGTTFMKYDAKVTDESYKEAWSFLQNGLGLL